MESELIGYFLPEKLLEFFKIERFEELGEVTTRKMCFYIYLEERNVIPMGYESSMYESKGFYPATTVQDFPIRGKSVYLIIKRRRWRYKERKNEVISNDYSLIAEGSKFTKELSDFLKATGRYP